MIDVKNKIEEFLTKFKDLSILGIGTFVANGIGGIFWLYIASLLGTEEYGKVTYFISIAIIASTVSLVGMSNTMIVFRAKGEKIQSSIYIVGIISPIITSVILFFIFHQNIEVSLYVIGFVTFTLIGAELIGLKSFSKYAKLIITQKIILVTLSIGLYHLIGYQGIILGMAISFLPFSIIIVKAFKHEKINFTILKSKYKFVVNSYLLDLVGAFNGSFDKIIIAPLLGFALLGNYQLGLQFLALLGILPGIFYQYILPHDSNQDSTKSIKKIMIIVSIIITIGSITLSPIIIPKIFPNFTEAVVLIQIMSVSVISSTIISIYTSKYLGLEKSKIVIIGSGIYLLVQIPTLIILTSYWGINGAGFSILIASIVHAIFFIIISKFMNKSKKENKS
jgi:O-antigen/teichoic acid export membrane protein